MTLKQENLTLKHIDKLFFIGQFNLSPTEKNLSKETTLCGKIYAESQMKAKNNGCLVKPNKTSFA